MKEERWSSREFVVVKAVREEKRAQHGGGNEGQSLGRTGTCLSGLTQTGEGGYTEYGGPRKQLGSPLLSCCRRSPCATHHSSSFHRFYIFLPRPLKFFTYEAALQLAPFFSTSSPFLQTQQLSMADVSEFTPKFAPFLSFVSYLMHFNSALENCSF